MTDPLEILRAADRTPTAPEPAFARQLRERLRRALTTPAVDPSPAPRGGEGGPVSTDTRGTAATAPVAEPERRPAPVQAGYQHVTAYLTVSDARRAIGWYVDVLGAERRGEPVVMPDGRIGHAEVSIGDSVLMLADEFPEAGLRGPAALGGPGVSLMVYVDDSEATVQRAVAAGAELERPVADAHGSRTGVVRDPFGHRWLVATALDARSGED